MNIYPAHFLHYSPIDKLRVRTLYLVVVLVVLQSQVNLAMRVADHGMSFSIILSYCIHLFLIINLLIVKHTELIEWPSFFLILLITFTLGFSGFYAGPFLSPGYYWFPGVCYIGIFLIHRKIAWMIPLLISLIYLHFLFPQIKVFSRHFPIEILNRTSATNGIMTLIFAFLTLREFQFHALDNRVLGILSVSYIWVLHVYHWLITGITGPFVIVILVVTQLFFPRFLLIQTCLVFAFILGELFYFPDLVPSFTQNKLTIFLLNTAAIWIVSLTAWYLHSLQKMKVDESTGGSSSVQ